MGKLSTKYNILIELVGDYDCDEKAARAAIAKHLDIVENAQRLLSYAYHPAIEIAQAEGFAYHGRLTNSEEVVPEVLLLEAVLETTGTPLEVHKLVEVKGATRESAHISTSSVGNKKRVAL